MRDNNQIRRQLFVDSDDECYDDQGKHSMLGLALGIALFLVVILAVMTTCAGNI
jgi:hypothetical protein